LKDYLQNKKILVTGGNRGIGMAISTFLVEHGAIVAVHYNRNKSMADKLKKKFPDSIFLIQANLSDITNIPEMFKVVIDNLGSLDVVVNNAGVAINSGIDMQDEIWTNQWLDTMNVNLNAVGLICKKAIQYFIEKSIPGKIINISSRAAFRGDTAEYMAYAASKGGIVSLTRSIARAYGKKGIVAFNIAPGFVKTDMAQQFFDQYGEDTALDQIALNELTTPKDIAPFVAFLASGLADHATGGTFDINAASYVH